MLHAPSPFGPLNVRYGFGWESQLLETGFLAIWICDGWILPDRRFGPAVASSPVSSARLGRVAEDIAHAASSDDDLGEEDDEDDDEAAWGGVAPPVVGVAVWGYRWLLFRVMLGAGLIKVLVSRALLLST